MNKLILLPVLLLVISACEIQTQDENKPAQSTVDPIFEAEREALKKAQGVEKMVMDAAKEQRQLIDAQEQ